MPSPARLVRPTLLAAALCAANLAVAAQPASAPFTPAQQQVIRQISASAAEAQVPLVASAAAASVAKTIEGEKQAIDVAKDALEVGRKSVDWWLSALGLLMAVAGIGIPFLMGRQQKAEWKERMDEISGKLAEANVAKEMAEAAQQQAEQYASEIDKLLHTANYKISLIPNAEQVTGKLEGDVLAKLRSEKPPQVVKLIQQALEAHEKEEWVAAKPLWKLLSLIESQDANVWFNLAYAEVHSGQNWQLICDGFQRSHLLEPSAVACSNWGNVLSDWANTLTGEAQQQRFAEADQRFAEAIRLKLDNTVAYYNWGNALFCWAKILTGEAQQQRFAEAAQRYAEATRLKPDFAEAYYNWGNALSDWAQTLEGSLQQQRFAEAVQRYAEATRLKSDFAEAYDNWGVALFDWAQTLTGEAQQQRFTEADQRYAEATRLKPDYAAAYSKWGTVLAGWAQTLTGEVQQQRFVEADRRYAEATRLRPDFAEAYSNWGNALFSWAKILKGEAQQQRYAEADQRFSEATRLKPDFAVVYYNWGITLLNWVQTLPSDERAAKLDEAERVLLLGKEKGSKNLYDLACLRAMQQRPDDARALLEETRAAGLLPDFVHLSTDCDLESLRGLDWFQALLEEVKQQEAGKQGST